MSSGKRHELDEMFEKINDSEEFKEFMKKFRTSELLNMDFPDWVKDKYWDEIDHEIWGRLGIYDYWDVRKAINTDFDDPSNLYSMIDLLKEENKRLIELAKDMEKKYRAVFKILSKMDSGLKAGEVLELMEDNETASEGKKKK